MSDSGSQVEAKVRRAAHWEGKRAGAREEGGTVEAKVRWVSKVSSSQVHTQTGE